MPDNPLANDAKLQQLLKDVDSIKSDEALASWRKSFLQVYQEYLDPDGVLNARDADGRLIKKLQALAKVSLKVQGLIDSKNICDKQVTAEGWNGIKNLNDQMKDTETAINVFCPKTSKDEEKVGYDKFELGAVLIKDGFHAYEIMTTTQKHIQEMKEGPLDGIIDKNSVSIMDFYFRGVQSFIDVMADLGLMGLAKQCVEVVYQEKARPPPSQPGPNGEPPADDFSEFVGGEKGGDPDKTVTKVKAPEKGKDKKGKNRPGTKTKKSIPAPGKPGGDRPNAEDAEDDEKKDESGEGPDAEFVLYWDPTTESFGRMPRERIGEIILSKDDDGKEVNNGAIEDKDEKDELVWVLKKLEKKKEKAEKAKGTWLDEIKKEKAKGKQRPAGSGKGPKKSMSVPVGGKKKPMKSGSSGGGWGPSPLMAGSSSPKGPGAKTRKGPARTKSLPKKSAEGAASPGGTKKKFLGDKPRAASPKKSVSGSAKKRNSGFEDYQGMYKTGAAKPANDGWSSVTPDKQ